MFRPEITNYKNSEGSKELKENSEAVKYCKYYSWISKNCKGFVENFEKILVNCGDLIVNSK